MAKENKPEVVAQHKYDPILAITADYSVQGVASLVDAILNQHNLAITTVHNLQVVPKPQQAVAKPAEDNLTQ